jgi:molybdopterin molybdotransferase
MITEAEALSHILSSLTPGGEEQVELHHALNRFSTRQLLATVPIPAFDNSSMDGYALHSQDSSGEILLRVTGEQPAGRDLHQSVAHGEAVRIFTGAPMPAHADAVIMQEDVERFETEGTPFIRCVEPVLPGENIRRAGADLCAGQIILRAGQRLTPALIGLLASQGLAEVTVGKRPRIAILSTGDEVIPAGQPLREGQVYNTNGPMLAAQLAQSGITNTHLVHIADNLDLTTRALDELTAQHDILLLSGGVSVGDHDHIKPALHALGMAPDLWRVKVKPGKPFLFARREHGALIFGLPGNPVSAFVTCHLFVRPAILRWMGAADDALAPQTTHARCASEISNPDNRPHYVRGRVNDGRFEVHGLQQSHALTSLSLANALLRVGAGETIAPDDLVRVIRLD